MKKLAAITLGVLSLSGCTSVAEYYRADPIINRNTSKNTATYYAVDGKSIDVTSPKFVEAVDKVTNEKDRNKLIREIMSVSDDVCELHKAGIISNSNNWNIATGSVSNVLSGLGSVVGGESTKAALSAGAALSNSTRSLVNQEVYANSLATTIIRAIDLKRGEARSAILQASEKQLDAYPVWAAIYDVDEYHRRCSFISGMIEVTKALENRKESQSQLRAHIAHLREEINASVRSNPAYNRAAIDDKVLELQKLLATAPEY